MMRVWLAVSLFCLLLVDARAVDAAVITFDELPDATVVGTGYGGVTFTNATALTAGVSLNEFEFPPVSGAMVAFDDGGPMRIEFSTPVISVGGFFTHSVLLTVQAFSSANGLLGSAVSVSGSNLGLSGEAGSAPNEFLSVTASDIAYVVITGDTAGGSFTLDDLSYQAAATVVPEPTGVVLLALGLCFVGARRF